MIASEKICDVLVEAGIEYVYGIPGGGTVRIFDALFDYQEKIKTVLVRHEQAGSIMADVYGRLTGKPGVVMGQGAFIGSSAAFGTMEAFMSSSPMLVLTDASEGGDFSLHVPYQSGIGEYGSLDLRGIFKSITKYTALATTPKEAVRAVQMAIRHATVGRPGPTCVIMRSEAITGEVDLDKPPKIYRTDRYLQPALSSAPMALVQDVEDRLRRSERPVIIAGNGVHVANAHRELQELAEVLSIPVATSGKGKSAFPENHPLALGVIGGFGQRVANRVVGEADTVLVVGCRLSPSDTMQHSPDLIDPDRQTLIQIDIDPRNAGWTYPVHLSLIGDAKVVLGQLLTLAMREAKGRDLVQETRFEELKRVKVEEEFFDHPALHSEDEPILPQRVVRELNESLPPSTIVSLDAGNNRIWMVHYFQSKEAKTVLCPGGIAGMGWAAPAAVGAQFVYPQRPCVSVSSDGGFALSLHALSTARQYDLPVVFVVMNDSALGMVYTGQGERKIASEFIETNFAKVAEGFDCQGIRVEKPEELGKALKHAIDSKRPSVVDVVISREQSLRALRSRRPGPGYNV